MNNRQDNAEYSTSDLKDQMNKLSHNIEQKYKEIIIMSEKISNMVDRSRKPNVKVVGVQKETKEQFVENNQTHFRRKLT